MTTITESDDLQLLRCFVKTNSQEAFGQLMKGHINLVYSACLRETNDPVLAQDATQAVFLTLFQKAPTIRKGTVLAGWLFNTSRFTARNARRQESRRKVMEQKLIEAMAHSNEYITENITWQTIEPLLHEAIASLGTKEREAILLRYFEEKSLKEVGLMLHTTEHAAQMRVSRALEKLKRYLQRNGVVVPVALLSALLSEHALQAAPASCAQGISLLLFGAATGTSAMVNTGLTATKAYSISQGVIKSMFLTKVKVVSTVAALGVAGVVGVPYVSNLLPVRADETNTKPAALTTAVNPSAPMVAAAPDAPADPPAAATPEDSVPTGRVILQQSKAAYAALSSYVGQTSVHTDNVINGKKSQYNGTATIEFTRPNHLHIDGLLASGGTYQLAYNGKTARVEMAMGDKEHMQSYASAEMGVAALTGVAAQAPTLIPASLMNFNWGNPFGDSQNARLEEQEIIDGATCYKVTVNSADSNKTFWIDVKSFLLRRYKREQGSIDLQKLTQSLQNSQQKAIKFPKFISSMSSTSVHEFTIDSVS